MCSQQCATAPQREETPMDLEDVEPSVESPELDSTPANSVATNGLLSIPADIICYNVLKLLLDVDDEVNGSFNVNSRSALVYFLSLSLVNIYLLKLKLLSGNRQDLREFEA